MMSDPPATFTIGSLYISGFAQARSPHVGLILPTSETAGHLVHIRIHSETSPTWALQTRTENITGNLFFSSLLKIHDVSAGRGRIDLTQLQAVAMEVPVPDNSEFGECSRWVHKVVQGLHEAGLVTLVDIEELAREFDEFAAGNRAFARRDRFPNVKVSDWCS